MSRTRWSGRSPALKANLHLIEWKARRLTQSYWVVSQFGFCIDLNP
jgi:hypothetical protein